MVLLVTAVAVATTPGSAAEPAGREGPTTVDASSVEGNLKSGTVHYKDVVITQGDTRVQADRASTTRQDLNDSRWTFEGNVRIHAEQRGNLRSDQAVVEFKDKRIVRATINGSPAEFEQKRADSEQMTHGHANEIVYDVNDGTVRLSNDAWLSDGRNEISGPLLVYNIREQKVEAASQPGTDKRVRIVITPSGKAEPEKKP
jgi:lipopolysaccharide transport protein LptA